MKSIIYFMLLLYALIFLAACNKEKGKEPERIRFNGITPTNIFAEQMGSDPSDWRFDDQWSEREAALFPAGHTQLSDTPDYPYRILAYPNPCRSNFFLYSDLKPGDHLSLRVVDRDYKIVYQADSVSSESFLIDVTAIAAARADTIRVYYKLYTTGKTYRGHGDVSLNF